MAKEMFFGKLNPSSGLFYDNLSDFFGMTCRVLKQLLCNTFTANFFIISLLSLFVVATNDLHSEDIVKQRVKDEKLLFYYGAYGSVNYNYHLAGFSKLGEIPNCCPKFKSGDGLGWSLGGLIDFEIAKSLFLDIRLGVSSLSALLKYSETDAFNVLVINSQPPYNPHPVTAGIEHTIDSKLFAVTLQTALTFNVVSKLDASVGFKGGYLIKQKFDQKEKLVYPDNVTFPDGRLIRNDYYDETIPDKNPFQMWGTFAFSYQLPIGRESYIQPEIRYDLPFTDVSSVEWKASVFQFGLSLKLPVFKSIEKPVERETNYKRDTSVIAVAGLEKEIVTLVESNEVISKEEYDKYIQETKTIIEKYRKEVPRAGSIETVIQAYGVKADGSKEENPTMVIEEMEMEEGFPLLPYIFFDKNSSTISNSVSSIITSEQTNDFSEDKLPWDALKVYTNLLNVIGSRMRDNFNATITVTGCNSNFDREENNLELSQARANAIKKYLTDVWGISSSRILIKSRNLPLFPGKTTETDGRIENQRAEISSSSKEILKPVTLSEIQRKSNPPLVELVPSITSEIELKNWELTISQNDKVIRSFSGKLVPKSLNWNVEEEPLPQFETPVNIKLKATDVSGKSGTDEKSISIKQLTIRKKRYELLNDRRIEKFSLIVFDYDKANINESQKDILKTIRQRISSDSKITIEGYTDRTGDKDYNLELSRRRCEEVRKVLNIKDKNVTLQPYGSDKLLYDNSTPQGRSYSRTVQIIVETPVKK